MLYDPRPVELPCVFEQRALTPRQLLELLATDQGPDAQRLREQLINAKRPVLVAGGDMLGAGGMLSLKKLALATSTAERSCLVHPVLGGVNSFGCALLSLPEQDDLLTRMESGRIKMLVCLETDPLLEAPEGERFAKSLCNLEELVVIDYLPTPLSVHAHLFIPSSAPPESAGSYINNEGRQQLFAPVIDPRLPLAEVAGGLHPPREFSTVAPGSDPQPAWRLLQQLLGDSGDLHAVREQMNAALPRLVDFASLEPGGVSCRVQDADERSLYADELPDQPSGSLQLVVTPARYGSDPLSRYSEKLSSRFAEAKLRLHPDDIAALGLNAGERVLLTTEIGKYTLTLEAAAGLAAGCALVENGPAFPHLLPGRKLGFCQVAAEVSHV
jgi:NADH-quinone oxidoreductase subunit G